MARDLRGDSVSTVKSARSRRPVARRILLVFRGDDVITHPLPPSGDLSIGRGRGCDVRIDDLSISRTHLTLSVGKRLTVTDRGSANGTFLRAAQLPEGVAVEVAPNELFRAGDVGLAVQEIHAVAGAVDAAEKAAPRPSGAISDGAQPIIEDSAARRLYELADRVARGDIAVLIMGETGVGKEVLAEYVHRRSPRAGGPLVRVNCAAIAGGLIESELFGHERGAFTGADRPRVGFIESAQGGTVFLDEVGELPAAAQAKLLRVLEDRRVTRVGSSTARPADVRFLAATNRDLEAEVQAGRFRGDLYFRLSGVILEIAPLRARPDDVAPLARVFAAAAAERLGRPSPRFTNTALAALRAHPWPGNVRQLRNAVERAMLLADGLVIDREHLPASRGAPLPAAPGPAVAAKTALPEELATLERQRIVEALDRCGGNQTRAAELLGMPRRTLVKRLAQYGLRARRS